jgi:hypothetical protein
MASLLRRLSSTDRPTQRRHWVQAPDGWGLGAATGAADMSAPRQRIDDQFFDMVQQVHRRHGVVAAAVFARALLLSGVRFRWRNERTRELFGNRALAPLERPDGMTRPAMLSLAENHASYSGAAFFWRRPGGVRLIHRPDWMYAVLGSNMPADVLRGEPGAMIDAEVIGWQFWPMNDPSRAQTLDPAEVAPWRPEPDPLRPWAGLSWVGSVLEDVGIDMQANVSVGKYFENGAITPHVYTFPESMTTEKFGAGVEAFRKEYGGARNAYKTLFLAPGADVRMIGVSAKDLALTEVRGRIDTKVSVRSRVHAAVLGTAEGMQGSALNAGNYSQVRRLTADGYFSPTVAGLCATLERILDRPSDAELWHDPSEILFLQEDQKDRADIISTQMQAVRAGIDAGFEPDAVVAAVQNDRLGELAGKHTGLTSVQLTPPDISGGTDD